MSDRAYRVESTTRLAQWRIDSLSTFSYRRSDLFKLGLWNWYLAVEKSKQFYVKLYPEDSSFTRENPPIASFNIKIVFPSVPNRQTLIHPGISDKQLKNNNDFVWAIDTLQTGRFIIDVEFLDLKILSPSVISSTSSFCLQMDSQADHVKDQCGRAKDDAEACKWYEEEIDDDLKWSFALNSVLHKGASKYQEIALIDTKRFGKVLVIDGKMQSAEIDEFIYHECLIHPSLLCHPNPKTVFIMGGGEGSAAREVLKHQTVESVVMCDIDEEVVDFCRKYLTVNQSAFGDSKLCLIINDAKAELEKREEQYDIIVGDLSDPMEGGPCYQLYTKSFYEQIVKPKLRHQGIFVTQAGPAGVLTHKEVFSSIYNTLKHVFKYVVAYTTHVPSFADMWGWVMASDEPLVMDSRQIDERIGERINGELLYLNGESLVSATTMNKSVYTSLLNETHIYTEENARFLYGHGKGW